MSEERIGTHLRAVEADVTPDPRFLDALHDQLADELGLASRRTGPRPALVAREAPLPALRSTARSRTRLLLLAAMLVVAGSAAALVGSRLAPAPEDRDDLLSMIRMDDRVRIGIVTGYPQAQAPDGAWGGFDVDVAALLAERLAVPAELVVSSGPDLRARPEAWDIAFPSMAEAPAGSGEVAAAESVYHWPVHLLVSSDEPVTTVADLTGRRVCVTAGSAGAAWAAGDAAVRSTTPPVEPPAASPSCRLPTMPAASHSWPQARSMPWSRRPWGRPI